MVLSKAPRQLTDDIEAWLAAGFHWRHFRFPLSLRAQYHADTRRDRSRAAGITGLLGAAVALLLYPVLLVAAPDVRPVAAYLFLGLAIPLTVLLSAIVLFDVPPWLREILLGLPVAVDATVLTYLFSISSAHATELYVAAIVLVLLYVCITVQVQFAVAAAASLYVYGLYVVCFTFLHSSKDLHAPYLIAMMGAIVTYVLVASWRLQADQRRSYVLTLRERLRQRDLAARNEVLDELAHLDPLTGLANRRTYDLWLERAWQQAAEEDAPLGLIMIDVDRFKSFNDANGHPAGDACLRAVATCIRTELEGLSELVARLGGEEFAILLPTMTEDACAALAESLRRAVEELDVSQAVGCTDAESITISCGAASLKPQAGTSAALLCAAADRAMYWAKGAGRNRVRAAGIGPGEGPPSVCPLPFAIDGGATRFGARS